jgi:hypothetical protein
LAGCGRGFFSELILASKMNLFDSRVVLKASDGKQQNS